MSSGERLRLVFGFVTLLIIAALAALIASGTVTQDASYGLEPILVALTSVAASFCNWAFSRDARNEVQAKSREIPTDEIPTDPPTERQAKDKL